MSFFKNIFKKPDVQRKLNSAKDLKINDMIVLTDSFGLPEALRSQEFQVSAINSYEFEFKTKTEWILTGHNNIELYLSLDVDDQTELKFSLKILHDDIETLFDLVEFASIFDEPGQAFLERKNDTEITSGWSSEQYQQDTFAKVGYFHRKDHRSEKLSSYEGKDSGEQLELYALHDQNQTRGIDVEVWQDGDTDVFLTLYRPLTDITDMFPGS
ncbi:MAG: hypothetical protein HRT37_08780 [Alteromonadaceae bacterium]|nr:hypothetical protein [Alteromonadaceae bacterium]